MITREEAYCHCWDECPCDKVFEKLLAERDAYREVAIKFHTAYFETRTYSIKPGIENLEAMVRRIVEVKNAM